MSGIVTLAGLCIIFIDPGVYPVDSSLIPSLVQGVLGATMMGWGVTMLLVARYAFAEGKPDLLRFLFYGILVWAPVDLAISVYYRAWFNVALNLAILAFAGIPLWRSSKRL